MDTLSKKKFSASDMTGMSESPTDGLSNGVLSEGGFKFLDDKFQEGDVGGYNPLKDGIKLDNNPFELQK